MDKIRLKHGNGSISMGFAENVAIGVVRRKKRAGEAVQEGDAE